MFDLDQFLPFRLNRVAERMSRHVMPVYREALGLGRPEWRVLAHMGARDRSTASELIGLTAMDKVKVSRAIAALEARGWVERAPDPADRRVIRLQLSPEGRAVHDALVPRMEARSAEVTQAMTPDERECLDAGLRALEEALATADAARGQGAGQA